MMLSWSDFNTIEIAFFIHLDRSQVIDCYCHGAFMFSYMKRTSPCSVVVKWILKVVSKCCYYWFESQLVMSYLQAALLFKHTPAVIVLTLCL